MGRRVLKGTGKILAAPSGSDMFRWIGDADSAVLNFEEDKVELKNHHALGGGVYATITRPGSGTIEINGFELQDAALEAGFAASVTAQAAGTKTSESHDAGAGQLSRFDFALDTSATVTIAEGVSAWANSTVYPAGSWVSSAGNYWYTADGGTSSGTGTADDTGVTWVDKGASPTVPSETDFAKTPAGVTLAESYTWPEGAPLLFSYTSKAGKLAEAQVNAAQEWRVLFDGFNEGESGEPVVVDVWSVKFSAQSLGLLSEEFTPVPLSGTVQSDSTRGTGESKFWRLFHADAV